MSVSTKKRKTKRRFRINLAVLWVTGFLALYVIIYVIPKLTGFMTTTYPAEYGTLTTSDKVTAYFVRDEEVFSAYDGGKANFLVDEAELVRFGTPILEVTPGDVKEMDSDLKAISDRLGKNIEKTHSYVSEHGGIISFFADGYEHKINKESVKKLDQSFFKGLKQDDVKSLKKSTVASKQPVYKIIDKGSWLLVSYIKDASRKKYKKGDKVGVKLNDKKSPKFEMKVLDILNEGAKTKLILEGNGFFEEYAKLRVADVSLITADVKGLLIEKRSLVQKNGKQGVYIKNKQGKKEFMPVLILSESDSKVAVSEGSFRDKKGNSIRTVRSYDDVIRRP